MWRMFVVLVTLFLGGCGKPNSERAIGENTQLKQNLADKKDEVTKLEKKVSELTERNNFLAIAAGPRGSALDDQRQSLNNRKTDFERQTIEAREDIAKRHDAVSHREQTVSQQERDFFKKSTLIVQEAGKAQVYAAQLQRIQSERDEAVGTANRWLKFIWGVSIALVLAVIACVTLGVMTAFNHAAEARRLRWRQEVAKAVSTTLQSQLTKEQVALVNDAFHQLLQLEDKR